MLVVFLALAPPVMAEQAAIQRAIKPAPQTKLLPLKGAASNKSCAAYGPGFVKIEGTDTCMHVGGSMSIGAGGTTTGR